MKTEETNKQTKKKGKEINIVGFSLNQIFFQ